MSKTIRETLFIDTWEKLQNLPMISMVQLSKLEDDLFKLGVAAEEFRKSRDKWRLKYEDERRKNS